MQGKRILLLLMGGAPLPFGTAAMGRWYYVLLRGLVERGHRVTAFATCSTNDEVERARALFPAPGYDLRCYLPDRRVGLSAKWNTFRRPYSSPLSSALQRDLDHEINRGFDVLHLEVLWSGWAALPHARQAVVNVPFLYQIDQADQAPASVQERLFRNRSYQAERRLLQSYPNIVAVSPRLAAHIRKIAPGSEVHSIPFAMDLSLYPFVDTEGPPGRDRPPTVGLIASFGWTPGYTAGMRLLQRLWPEVKRRVPEAKLQLKGVHARTAFRDYLSLPDVEIEDQVTDVPGFFEGIDLQLYPPNPSSGMKFKVLESFAFGVPVVTNAAGVEGIPAKDGVHAGICEDDAGMIDRAVALLESAELRQRHRVAARALLEEHCSAERVLGEFENIYARIAPATEASRTFSHAAVRPRAHTNIVE
jgi:glycosyltransferase involved in cell wall biosynthesis